MSGLIDLDVIAGAKATLRYGRLSASKARVVLNLIRDEDLALARDRLRLCERGAAEVVSKVLESAVANAVNNEQLDADELYVAECWADEGPVLKRWRPRARGRATRIHKQTCHITVIVAQLSPEELEMREARLAASGSQTAAAARAARVAASRATDGDEATEDEAAGDEIDSAKELDAAETSDAAEAPEEIEASEAAEVPEEIEASEAAEVPEEIEASEAAEAPEEIEASEAAEAPEEIEASDTPDTGAVVEAEAVAEAVEGGEASDSAETADSDDADPKEQN